MGEVLRKTVLAEGKHGRHVRIDSSILSLTNHKE